MTVSNTYAFNPTADEIITTALQRCGRLHAQQTPKAEQYALGRKFLQARLHALEGDGARLNVIERYTSALTAGTAYVDAPADTVSIESSATVRDSNDNDYSLQGPISRAHYMSLADKNLSGKPSHYYPEVSSTNTVRIYLWPVPTSDYASITYVRARLPRDVDTGDVTLDAPPKFVRWATLAVGADFAGHYRDTSMEDKLELLAAHELNKAMNTETPKGDLQFVVPRLIGGGF